MKKKSERLLGIVLAVMIVMSFIVPASAAATPEVKILSATDITETSAVLRGEIVKNGGVELKQYGFAYDRGNGTEYKFFNGHIENGKTFTFKVTGLKPGTTYSFQVIAVSANGNEGKSSYKNYTTKTKSNSNDSSGNKDKEKPEIQDFDCSEGIAYTEGKSAKFYAEVTDNDEISEVVLYIDGKNVKTSKTGDVSYKTSSLAVGKHTIKVVAWDVSGNKVEESMTVTVKAKKETTTVTLQKLSTPKVTVKSRTIKTGEKLSLSWNSVANADYYTIHCWTTEKSWKVTGTSYNSISFDKEGTYSVSVYAQSNTPANYPQSEPFGVNIVVEKEVCKHSTTVSKNADKKYVAVDEINHNVTAYYNRVCKACGVVIESNIKDSTSKEKHSFTGNKCTKCNYQKEEVCRHSATVSKTADKKYTSVDETNHNVTTYHNRVCKDCEEITERNIKGSTTKEKHNFSGNKCTKCNYTKETTTVTSQKLSTPKVTVKSTTIKTGEKLSLSWNSVANADYYTIHCWTTEKSWKVTGTSYNSISFDKEGTYSVAVYAQSNTPTNYPQSEPFGVNIVVESGGCKHTSTKNESTSPKYSVADETYHNKIEYNNKICTECGVTVQSNIQGETRKEMHSFSGNKCAKCNYEKVQVEEAKKHSDSGKTIVVGVGNANGKIIENGNVSNIKVENSKNQAVAPYIKNGRTLIPLRFVAETFGATVDWDASAKTASVTINGNTAYYKIGSKKFTFAGKTYTDDAAPEIDTNTNSTFIPLRKMCEIVLGLNVAYIDNGTAKGGVIVIYPSSHTYQGNSYYNNLISAHSHSYRSNGNGTHTCSSCKTVGTCYSDPCNLCGHTKKKAASVSAKTETPQIDINTVDTDNDGIPDTKDVLPTQKTTAYITEGEMSMILVDAVSPMAYTYMMHLSYKYFLADTQQEKTEIHKKMDEFRKSGYKNSNGYIITNNFDDQKVNVDGGIAYMPSLISIKPTKEQHYFRNELNLKLTYGEFQKIQNNGAVPYYLKWNNNISANFHQNHKVNGKDNEKWVSYCGFFELIYNGNNELQTEYNNPCDMGTYNYAPSDGCNDIKVLSCDACVEHRNMDVVPWGGMDLGFFNGAEGGFANVENQKQVCPQCNAK